MASHSQTTRILAQIAGPFTALVGVAVVLRGEGLAALIEGLEREPTAIFILGVLTLLIGLTMLVLHHRWRSPVEIVLSALGVLMIVRGAALLAAPDLVTGLMHRMTTLLPLAWMGGALAILLGAWLAYEGYLRKPAVQ